MILDDEKVWVEEGMYRFVEFLLEGRAGWEKVR
jgi:hypothetical protein